MRYKCRKTYTYVQLRLLEDRNIKRTCEYEQSDMLILVIQEFLLKNLGMCEVLSNKETSGHHISPTSSRCFLGCENI